MPGNQGSSGAFGARMLGRRYIVFDVDAMPQAARQRALSCDPALLAVIAQLILAGVYLVTRERGYQILEHRQLMKRI